MATALPVQVRGLTKTYSDHTAVDALDLDVHAGEIVGLLGSNGAGKTTTVECIQGLRRRDRGSISVLGIDPGLDGPRVRRMVGSQQQESTLPDRMRVGEAITLSRGPRATSVDGLLEAFGLAGLRKKTFAALSGGQRQRLFLVLAVLNRPRLVILDELTQGLDPAARRDVWDAISVLRDSGTTVLLVTHDMDEAEALCDRGRRDASRSGRRLGHAGRPRAATCQLATVRFGAGGVDLGRLRMLPGVSSVTELDGKAEIRGDRAMIAHVCAELVQDQVPSTSTWSCLTSRAQWSRSSPMTRLLAARRPARPWKPTEVPDEHVRTDRRCRPRPRPQHRPPVRSCARCSRSCEASCGWCCANRSSWPSSSPSRS